MRLFNEGFKGYVEAHEAMKAIFNFVKTNLKIVDARYCSLYLYNFEEYGQETTRGDFVSNKIPGTNYYAPDAIKINPEIDLQQFIKTMLHESRHYYQCVTNKRSYLKNKNPKTYWGYYFQWIEIDARLYSYFTYKRYKKQLNELIKDYVEPKYHI